MGQYFKFVNPVKRQYIDPFYFGENIKASGVLQGYHAIAIAVLVCKLDEVQHDFGELAGSWYGHPIIVAGDDNGMADAYGVKTSTADNPERNLNSMAEEEFEDITYRSIAMLCEGREGFAEEIAKYSKDNFDTLRLMFLGNVVFQVGCRPLEEALEKVYGHDWVKEFKQATEEHR